MKCGQETCNDEATWRMFWPGDAPRPVCAKHAEQARGVAQSMGFFLHVEPLDALDGSTGNMTVKQEGE